LKLVPATCIISIGATNTFRGRVSAIDGVPLGRAGWVARVELTETGGPAAAYLLCGADAPRSAGSKAR
jgi:hypothetical protein